MLACGLPVVDVDVESMHATFGTDGPVLLASPDPLALADALEAALDDPGGRPAAGLEFVAGRTWERAAEQLEAALLSAAGDRG
jgi:glycosyltransferase involved in cell wall biosynthesis